MMERAAVMDEIEKIANVKRKKFESSNVVIVVKEAPSFLHSTRCLTVSSSPSMQTPPHFVDVRTVPTMGARSENRSRRSG